MGRHLSQAPYLQSVLLAGRTLALAGADEALTGLLAVGARHALALFEPGQRYRWDAPATRAEPTAEGWTISGAKVAVLDHDGETVLLCPAATPRGLGLFLIPPGTSNVLLAIQPTPDGRHATDVTLDAVTLPPEAAIGDPARNRAILAEAVDGAILGACAEMVGAMEQLLAITVDYLNVRQQFGAVIGSFQALQHRAADMLIAIERARSIMIYAASMMEAPEARRSVAVAAAKALVNRSARFVGQQAIQLHGGMGLASDYPAGRYFQRLTVLGMLFGDTDHQRAVVAAGGGWAG
nr:acyl-CoA dehydrogenase [Sphingobium nicotianae]